MPAENLRFNVAVLDDYQGVALELADWSDVFREHLSDPDAVIDKLLPYDVVCVMRERTPLTRHIMERLPRLKMISSTGRRNASIDSAAASERGIEVMYTGYSSAPTIEFTWALILASVRHIATENASLRNGGWQLSLGDDIAGKTLGIIGCGNIGSQVAKVGLAFGMQVVAWSQNLTLPKAEAAGATLVSKEELLRVSDIVSIHLVLSERTTGLIGEAELALMKPSAHLVNTSRGAIVAEAPLLRAPADRRIAGAAIDVYDREPLPLDHPYRTAERLLATPHIGYVARGLYERFYTDTAANVSAWLSSAAPGTAD